MVSDWKITPHNDGRYHFRNSTFFPTSGRAWPSRASTITVTSWNGPSSRANTRSSPCGATTRTTPSTTSTESLASILSGTLTITGSQVSATVSTAPIITRSATALLLDPDLTATARKTTSVSNLTIVDATSPTNTAVPTALSAAAKPTVFTTLTTPTSFSGQANLAKQTLASSAVPNPTFVPLIQTSHHLHTAKVVGATVGSLAALAVLVLLGLLYLRRRRKRKRLLLPETAEIQPGRTFPSWPSRLSMYLPSSPTRNPYFDGRQHAEPGASGPTSRFTAPPPGSKLHPASFATPIYDSFRSRTSPFPAIKPSPSPSHPSFNAGRPLETMFIPPPPASHQPSQNPATSRPPSILPNFLARPSLAASRSRSRASSVTSRVVSSRFSLDSRGERRKSDPFDLEGAG